MGKFTRKRCERRTPVPVLVGADDILLQLRMGPGGFQITLVTWLETLVQGGWQVNVRGSAFGNLREG